MATPAITRGSGFPSGTFELVINLRDDALRIYNPAQIDQYRRLPI